MAECFESDGVDCPLVDACTLNAALKEALNAFFAVLSSYTIEGLVRTRPDLHRLLGLEAVERPALAS